MKSRGLKFSLVVFLVGAAAVLTVGIARADVFMRQQVHRDASQMMGQNQPASDSTQTMWMAAEMMRRDSDNTSVIVRLDKKMVYFLDNSRKTYFEMPLDFEKAMAGMGKSGDSEDKEMQEAMKKARGAFKMSMTVTDTGERKKIGNWNCRKYIREMSVGMGPVTSEVWATEDLRMDFDLNAQFNAAMMAMQPGGGQSIDQTVAEMKKIEGVPVLTVTNVNVMGSNIRSTEELLEFREGKAPAGIFEVPRGYVKEAGPAMGGPPRGRRPAPSQRGQ